ncbi:hypothetical protein E3Q24_01850 [Wallemia mellicola]|nr:hypothetical protein E3Q24_01850 [Wallemia mellicola]
MAIIATIKAIDGDNDWSCTIRDSCRPCPEDNINDPVCQPFGNRQLLLCYDTRTSSKIDSIPAWHSCGRLPTQERNTFLKFVSLNFALTVTATMIVLIRNRQIANAQYDKLAKTIGLPDAKSPDGPLAAAGRLLKFLRT